MGTIYAIENLENGKVYIGSTTRPWHRRWIEHCSKLRHGRHGNAHLQHAWDYYGENAFEFVVVEDCIPGDELIEAEQYWLDRARAAGEVYNTGLVARNPMLGQTHTAEARRKISLANVGKTISAAARLAVSAAHKGKVMSAETRRKISEAKKGWRPSEETRRRMSEACKGRRPPNYGVPHTRETRRKISEALGRPYPAFIHQSTGEIIPAGYNLRALCRECDLERTGMSRVISGKQHDHRGWELL